MKNARLLGLGFCLRSRACFEKHICTALSFNATGHDTNDDECGSAAAASAAAAAAAAAVTAGALASSVDDSCDDVSPAASARRISANIGDDECGSATSVSASGAAITAGPSASSSVESPAASARSSSDEVGMSDNAYNILCMGDSRKCVRNFVANTLRGDT